MDSIEQLDSLDRVVVARSRYLDEQRNRWLSELRTLIYDKEPRLTESVFQRQQHEAEIKERPAPPKIDRKDFADAAAARKTAVSEQRQSQRRRAADMERWQVPSEKRSLTQLNGVQNVPDLLAVTWTTDVNNDSNNCVVYTPPPPPPIARTPPPAPSPPMKPPQLRRQPPPPPNPPPHQPNNDYFVHCWIPQTMYLRPLQDYDLMVEVIDTKLRLVLYLVWASSCHWTNERRTACAKMDFLFIKVVVDADGVNICPTERTLRVENPKNTWGRMNWTDQPQPRRSLEGLAHVSVQSMHIQRFAVVVEGRGIVLWITVDQPDM